MTAKEYVNTKIAEAINETKKEIDYKILYCENLPTSKDSLESLEYWKSCMDEILEVEKRVGTK